MATARGNCFDGSEGRGPAPQSRDLKAARGLVLTTRSRQGGVYTAGSLVLPPPLLRHEEATAQGVLSVTPERPVLSKSNGGVLIPEDLG